MTSEFHATTLELHPIERTGSPDRWVGRWAVVAGRLPAFVRTLGLLLAGGLLAGLFGGALAGCTAKAPIEDVGVAEEAAERLVVDVRDPEPFAAGHLPGALNIQLTWDQLEDRMDAYVPDRSTPLAVRAASEEDAQVAAAILLELGYQDFKRIVPEPGDETATLPLMTAEELAQTLAATPEATRPIVLDIRTAEEFEGGVIPGAIRIDQDAGPAAVADLDRTRTYAVICAGGWRSSQLATYMRREGFEDVTNVIDGMWAWDE